MAKAKPSKPAKPAKPAKAAKPAKPAKKRVMFTLEAPQAGSVLVTGSFCEWQTETHWLKKDKAGVWKVSLLLPVGTYEYRFMVDGHWRDDPQCQERVRNSFGTENCVLHVVK